MSPSKNMPVPLGSSEDEGDRGRSASPASSVFERSSTASPEPPSSTGESDNDDGLVAAATNAGHFFEGVEKLLEVWFATDEPPEGCDLRKIPR